MILVLKVASTVVLWWCWMCLWKMPLNQAPWVGQVLEPNHQLHWSHPLVALCSQLYLTWAIQQMSFSHLILYYDVDLRRRMVLETFNLHSYYFLVGQLSPLLSCPSFKYRQAFSLMRSFLLIFTFHFIELYSRILISISLIHQSFGAY